MSCLFLHESGDTNRSHSILASPPQVGLFFLLHEEDSEDSITFCRKIHFLSPVRAPLFVSLIRERARHDTTLFSPLILQQRGCVGGGWCVAVKEDQTA
jgi:hypothetical protein